ncbi:unnamed protein product, partial [Rhizoctonia solani]
MDQDSRTAVYPNCPVTLLPSPFYLPKVSYLFSISLMPKLPTIDTRRAGAKPRVLALCFDGTTNIYDETNTNVVKLFSLLKRDDREEQMVYYQPGVGTYVPPGILLPITHQLAKIADQGVALYLDKHVMGGYEFLMKHYNDGDKI